MASLQRVECHLLNQADNVVLYLPQKCEMILCIYRFILVLSAEYSFKIALAAPSVQSESSCMFCLALNTLTINNGQ